jgi:HEAT repeat protein
MLLAPRHGWALPLVLLPVLLLCACSKEEKPPDIPALLTQLQDTREGVRGPAIISLIAIGEPAAVPVTTLLTHPDHNVRAAAAQTLWGLGQKAKGVVPQIAQALSDSNAQVRANAAMSLETIGPDAAPAVKALIPRLKDSEWNVRQYAAKALGAIGPAAVEAVPALEEAAKDDFVRDAAAQALQNIQRPR